MGFDPGESRTRNARTRRFDSDQLHVWTILWALWGVMFAVIEGVAIANDKRGDTLSEHFRLWFRTDTRRGRTVWLAVSGAFFAWFVVHIAVAGSA